MGGVGIGRSGCTDARLGGMSEKEIGMSSNANLIAMAVTAADEEDRRKGMIGHLGQATWVELQLRGKV